MKHTRRSEVVVDRRTGAGGLPVPPGIRLISFMVEGLRGSMSFRARKRASDEGRAGSVRGGRPDTSAARSPMDVGITGGMSLLFKDLGVRDRRS